ncbi:MAG: hypothetical protein IKR25_11335 [Muribaculaceae bacterium]|nr:hypothetical protein [Muribaculaceae bacterium]
MANDKATDFNLDDFFDDDPFDDDLIASTCDQIDWENFRKHLHRCFVEWMLPEAINSKAFSTSDLIYLWKNWQRSILGLAIYSDLDSKHGTLIERLLSDDLLKRSFLEDDGCDYYRLTDKKPSDDDIIELLRFTLNFIKTQPEVQLRDSESEEEKKLIEQNIEGLLVRFMPTETPDKQQFRTWIKQAKDNNDNALAFYYFFFYKYLHNEDDFAKNAVSNAANWEKMIQLQQNPHPKTAEEVKAHLFLLRELSRSGAISDVIGFLYFGAPCDFDRIAQDVGFFEHFSRDDETRQF